MRIDFPAPSSLLAAVYWILGILGVLAVAMILWRKRRAAKTNLEAPVERHQWWYPGRPSRLVVMVLFTASVVVGFYPSASQWLTSKQLHEMNKTIIHEQRSDPDRLSKLKEVVEYNSQLPAIAADSALGGDVASPNSDAYRRYEQLLVPGPYAAIGAVQIPRIAADIPIYHGTSKWALDHGAGHLFGTSLPVGGKGNRSVITAHSGLANMELFTRLPELQDGDTFDVVVMGERFRYRVVERLRVEPTQVEFIAPVPQRDLVTLITCVPVGVNSHRLLVTGERIPLEVKDVPGPMPKIPGFPWWLPLMALLIASSIWYGIKPVDMKNRHVPKRGQNS